MIRIQPQRYLFAAAAGLLLGIAATGAAPARFEASSPRQAAQPSQEDLRKLFLSGDKNVHQHEKPAAKPPVPPPPSSAPRKSPSLRKTVTPHPARAESKPPPDRQHDKQHASQPTRPAPTPSQNERRAAKNHHPKVQILKEGSEEADIDDYDEPTPTPEPKKKRWGLFGPREEKDSKRYKYLTPALRKQLDKVKIRRGRWRYIIVHNSGSRNGNAKIFDHYHRRVKKMRNGMAYHFVIGNGSATAMGKIEVGDRWWKQINGGHVASDRLNDIGIGICLVGDYNKDNVPERQLEALKELVEYLRQKTGGTRRKLPAVKGHREINPKPTDCPGEKFPLRWLHRTFD